MARKSTATTAASTRGRKRGPPANDEATTATPTTRSSKRIKESANNTPTNGNVTPKKSKYFEQTVNSEGEELESADDTDEHSGSGYEDEQEEYSATEVSEPESEEEDEEDYDSEEEKRPKKNRGRKPANTNESTQAVGNDLWREGVKTGLGPGKQVFIAKPKPRDDGGIPYKPHKIHPNTMAFLADLKKNNDREWLKRHDPDYRQSWKDWETFVESLTEKIVEVDDTIPELPAKDFFFRIYRDVRFSSDPTPYKAHYCAAWSRTGRKGPYAGYYVQIQPGDRSFVGSGMWHPDAQPLSLIRRNIDRKPEKLMEVLMDEKVRKLFGGVPKDKKKAVKAFCNSNSENALKTKPKGYDADHPNIELLRLRNFTIGKGLKDDEVLSPKGLDTITELIKALCPFVTYLNSVVMPDEGDDMDDDDDDDDDDAAQQSNDSDSAVDGD